jgi:hypothetical protein
MPAMADTTSPSPVFVPPPAYFEEALADAECLLKYAAESGMSVDDATRNSVLQARAASNSEWTEEAAANLMTALTVLAALAKPVTAASLKACQSEIAPTVRSYLITAICLAALIVPFSMASFLVSAISNTLRNDISTANDLAVKLDTQIRPPDSGASAAPSPAAASPTTAPEATPMPTMALRRKAAEEAPAEPVKAEQRSRFVPCYVSSASATPAPLPPGVNQGEMIEELQQYASLIRSIDARARQLNAFVFKYEGDPCNGIRNNPAALHRVFELPAGLPNLAQATDDRTAVYQEVRYFAQSLLDDTSFYYGAITICLLPALYALLGTCAYLLRTFEQQMSTQTFIPSGANSARFLIAGIGGAVVGLFNNFAITKGASIPPLAIAFLVGYGVDVFFAFLEGMLQTFTRSAPAPSRPAQPDAK